MNAARKEQAVGPLREYDLTINGAPTTVLLTEEDAAKLGATPVPEPALPAVDLPPGDIDTKARRPLNKARRPDQPGGATT
jgi:hypothetical protein